MAAGRADAGARLRSVLPNTPHRQSSVTMSVNRHGGPQLTVVCWPKGSSEKGRHLEPKAPSFHFLEVSAGMKSHGSGWWGARDSRQAQARGGVPGQAQPRAPSCLLSVPACPAHSMLLGARAWRGLSPTFSAVSAPWSRCAWGREGALDQGHSPSSHGSQWGRAELSCFPGEERGAGLEGLGPGPLTGALGGWTCVQDSQPQDAPGSFRSRPHVVLGHPRGEIGWGQGRAGGCGSAVSCPS